MSVGIYMVRKKKDYDVDDSRQTLAKKQKRKKRTKSKTSSMMNKNASMSIERADHPYFKNYDIVQEDGRTIQIRDLMLALGVSAKIFSAILVICALLFFLIPASNVIKIIIITPIFIVGLWFLMRVWNSYNHGILVSSKYDKVNFPASDVENTLMDIITLKRLRNLANRLEYDISELDKVWLDRQRKRVTYTDMSGKKPKSKTKTVVVYTVNIAGAFGSKNIVFNSRQKRDEFRSAISICAKDLGLKLRIGSNIDMQ